MNYTELLQKWMQEKQFYQLKHRTFLRYQELIRTHIEPKLGNIDVENITIGMLKDFQNEKLTTGNIVTGGALACNTVKNLMSIIKSSLEYGRNEEHLNTIEPKTIVKVKFKEKPTKAFRKDEQKLIEKAVFSSKKTNHFGVILCLYTGLRLGELLALTWDDIDFHLSELSVNKTSCFLRDDDGKYKIYVDRPKTETSTRIIPIPKAILSELKTIKKKSKSKFVISTHNGGMVTNRSYQTTYKKILEKAGVEYRNFHVTRHTFATRALECGMDIKTLSEILGHKSPTVTMNRYAHSLMETKIKMMNHLAKTLEFGKEKCAPFNMIGAQFLC